jgi:hypothetical protein
LFEREREKYPDFGQPRSSRTYFESGAPVLWTLIGRPEEYEAVRTCGAGADVTIEIQFAASSAWSPDMRFITFRLTDYDYWNFPDCKDYVYREKKADKRPVWIMQADGSHPTIIEALHYRCALDGSRPVWKPQSCSSVRPRQ